MQWRSCPVIFLCSIENAVARLRPPQIFTVKLRSYRLSSLTDILSATLRSTCVVDHGRKNIGKKKSAPVGKQRQLLKKQ